MNTGVEILLQRLKDCPEDFDYDISSGLSSRWLKLVQKALESDFITQEEKDALTEALRENHRNEFTEHVMKTLTGEGEASDEGKSLLMGRHPIQGTGLGGQTLVGSLEARENSIHSWTAIPTISNGGTGSSSIIQLGNETLDEHLLKKIKRKLGI